MRGSRAPQSSVIPSAKVTLGLCSVAASAIDVSIPHLHRTGAGRSQLAGSPLFARQPASAICAGPRPARIMSSSAHLDTPSAPAATAEEPPPQDGWPGGLAALRAELDRIDDALHALLMQRARVVERVARSGKRSAYRPGREASIIRRLLRQHSGTLPAQTLVRIWRELLAGTTAMQGPFAVAVCEPDAGAGFTQAAREHFGALTPLHVYGSPAQAMAEV